MSENTSSSGSVGNGQRPAVRVQLRRTAGWRKPAGAVVVARPTAWGNPFDHRALGRATAITRYQQWLTTQPALLARARRDLAGKDLCCWCPLDQPCHADVLLAAANHRPDHDQPVEQAR